MTMKLSLAALLLVVVVASVSAFAPSSGNNKRAHTHHDGGVEQEGPSSLLLLRSSRFAASTTTASKNISGDTTGSSNNSASSRRRTNSIPSTNTAGADEQDQSSWQVDLERLLDPTISVAQRQILLSRLLSANSEIRESVQTALRDRKVSATLHLLHLR